MDFTVRRGAFEAAVLEDGERILNVKLDLFEPEIPVVDGLDSKVVTFTEIKIYLANNQRFRKRWKVLCSVRERGNDIGLGYTGHPTSSSTVAEGRLGSETWDLIKFIPRCPLSSSTMAERRLGSETWDLIKFIPRCPLSSSTVAERRLGSETWDLIKFIPRSPSSFSKERKEASHAGKRNCL